MNFITHNLHLKILALLAAIALWFFVVGIENSVSRFPQDIEVHALNLPQNLVVTSALGKAKLVITAGGEDVRRLSTSDFDVYVDLKNYGPGEYSVPLAADVKNEKITLLRIEPSTIQVKIEPIVTKEVKIKAVSNGNLAKGYVLKDTKLSQDTAKITGPESLLQNLSAINAVIALNTNQISDFEVTVPLSLDPKLITTDAAKLQNITLDPEQVTAQVSIESQLQQKTVPVKARIVGDLEALNAAGKVEVEPQSIVIQGTSDVLAKVDAIETEGVLATHLLGQIKAFKVNLVLPPDVTLVPGEESRATMTFIKKNTTNPSTP